MKTLLALLVIAFASVAQGALIIDFEDIGGDNIAITNQYETSHGVVFSMKMNGVDTLPYSELVGEGDSVNGFLNDQDNNYDQARALIANYGQTDTLGEYFLRAPGSISNTGQVELIVNYILPVAALRAELWDIDAHTNGYEKWLVTIYDGNDNPLASQESPTGIDASDPNSLDSLKWKFEFDRAGVFDVHKMTIMFIGSKTSGVGIAFDRFYVDSIPEPATMCMLALGGVAMLRRRNRK